MMRQSNWKTLERWMDDKDKREVKLGNVIKEPKQNGNIFVCRKFLEFSGKIFDNQHFGFPVYNNIKLDRLDTVKPKETRTDVLIIDIQRAYHKQFMILLGRGGAYVLSSGVEIDKDISNKIDYAKNEIAKNMI